MMHTEKLFGNSSIHFFQVRGYDHTGKNAWYLVEVTDAKAREFKTSIDSGKVTDLNAYGKVVDSGYGDKAPISVVESVRKQYS